MKKSIALLAVCATALSPILAAPAFAAVTVLDTTPPAEAADFDTLGDMEDQCDAKALARGPNWSGVPDLASISASYVSGPTELGTHTYDDNGVGDREGRGTFTPAHQEIEGDPYRNGGSVNMFGDAIAVGGYYSASDYDFEAEFETTYLYSFNCKMSEEVFTPQQGFYYVDPLAPGNSANNKANCDAFTALGPNWANWGDNQAFCLFQETAREGETEQPRPDEAGTPVEQSRTDTLLANEDAGEGFSTDETLFIGKVVVCISPTTSTQTKKGAPGTWVAKNGYELAPHFGAKCTTEWYNGGATTNVSNLNTGSHNVVTVPVV